MTRRRLAVVVALVITAVASVLVAPSSSAQVLPTLPPLPPPPADGNVLADVLGPAAATACDAVATVYGLAGPIASAQLPPQLQALLPEVDPYLALVTYACGYLVVPPSGVQCAADTEVTKQAGLLGLPVSPPAPFSIFYDTAAGIEHALLRLGLDVGTDASRQLATALGCGVPEPSESGPPAALPVTPPAPTREVLPSFVAPSGGAFAAPAIPAVAHQTVPGQTTVLPGTLGQLGALHYPVRGVAALLLALPLLLLAAGVAVSPRLRLRRRPRPGPTPVDGPS